MNISNKLINAAFESDEAFISMFSKVIKEDLNTNVIDFSKSANISSSTLYKILLGDRKPNIKTLRQIVNAIKSLENIEKKEFIAVIAVRPVLNTIGSTKKSINGKLLTIKEYSANSIEDVIVASIHAERDGAKAIVCAPIVSHTIEKILQIPVATIMPKTSLDEAIELAARKMT